MLFYLGVHREQWLATAGFPLFVSRNRLVGRRSLPRARARWALDSGAFTELGRYGRWTVPPATFVVEARRYRDEIGHLDWAAIQDWMCEPFMLARTGKSIREHQRLTINSYLELRALAPDVPWVPVLQGWHQLDYVQHVFLYRDAGVDLRALPVVGVGSICRRQATAEAESILGILQALGLRLHGFGLKLSGLPRCAQYLASADSMAWSFAARRLARPQWPGCTHRNCANCFRYAEFWRGKVLDVIGRAA